MHFNSVKRLEGKNPKRLKQILLSYDKSDAGSF